MGLSVVLPCLLPTKTVINEMSKDSNSLWIILRCSISSNFLEKKNNWGSLFIKVKKMPLSCKNAFQATPNGHNAWHWLKVKKVCAIFVLSK